MQNTLIAAKEDATQEEVDSAYEALIKAYLDLSLKPNKDLLQELINTAQTLNAASYSAKTWNVVTEALKEAQLVLNDPEASQVEVDNAKDVLAKAIARLEVNPAETPVKAGDTTSIKTGDDSTIGLLSMVAVLISYKRKED